MLPAHAHREPASIDEPGHRRGPPARRRLTTIALVLTGAWALAASYGLVFRDDVVRRLLAGQRATRAAYEARLADLEERLERARDERTGADAADAARLAAAIERQAELERRLATLRGLGGARVADPLETGALADPPDASGGPRRDGADGPGLRRHGRRSGLVDRDALADLETRLDQLHAAQTLGLHRLTQGADAEVRSLRAAIGFTGLDPARFDARLDAPFDAPLPEAVGGPLVPLPALLGPEPFADALDAAQRSLGEAERLSRLADALPLRRPVTGQASLSSGFGVRLDPFTRGLALHTGLDFKAETGEPALATAPGRVTAAETAGGYGRMVEIDHGNGVVTRFAHLAQVLVHPGQRVRAGETVGLVGSTGRSTGAHLHYETRIDGEPVDPQRFLDAGRHLGRSPGP